MLSRGLWILLVCAFVHTPSLVVAADDDSVQVAAVRQMHKLAQAKDWRKLYDESHPELKSQLDAQAFDNYMNGAMGKPIVELIDRVLKLVDDKADADELIAKFQEDDQEYEFVLPKVLRATGAERKGQLWHLELKLDDGEWKLRDTD